MSAIGHAHLDTAWLWPLEETWRKLVRTTTTQLRLMDAYPEHRFAHSQAQHYAWLPSARPALFARVREARRARPVDPGRRACGSSRTATCPSGESLARQLLYGQRFFEARARAPLHGAVAARRVRLRGAAPAAHAARRHRRAS